MRSVSIALAILLQMVAACSDTQIIGQCAPLTDARLVAGGVGLGTPYGMMPSVGVVGDMVFVSYLDPTVSTFPYHVLGQWVSAVDGTPIGPVADLGYGAGTRPHWAPIGGALEAQLWTYPTLASPFPRPADRVYVWTLSPSSPPATARVAVRVSAAPTPTFPEVYLGAFQSDPEGQIPFDTDGTEGVGAFVGVFPDCPGPYTNDYDRAYLFYGDTLASHAVGLGGDMCDRSQVVAVPTIVSIDRRKVGLLYRPYNPIDGRVEYVWYEGDPPTLAGGPVVVGGSRLGSTADSGQQPHAVRVGAHILFTERRGGENSCQGIRVMNTDGTGAADAPWQLPCGNASGAMWISFADLATISGAGVLVWGEHTRLGPIEEPVSSAEGYVEAVRAVLLTEDGRRGSEIVTVSESGFTALDSPPSPSAPPNSTRVFATGGADGTTVGVAWQDMRADAPGVYVRALRCQLR